MSDQENSSKDSSWDILSGKIQSIEEQNNVLLQQITELSITVYGQSDQLNQTNQSMLKEFKKLQSGGPQRAMASLFHKLFKELIEHINHLDDLLEFSEEAKSIIVLRSHFETILEEWGLLPIKINEGRDEFDPEIHESIDNMDVDIPEDAPDNTIIKVQRRGWSFHGTVLQCPQVVVS